MIDENKLIEDINNLKGLKRIKSCMYSESGNTLFNELALNLVKEVIKLINEQPKDHDLEWYKHEYYAECDRVERLEKALDKVCEYIHFNGYNGCPHSYDGNLLNDGKKKCTVCDFSFMNIDDAIGNEEYKEKSCKCWKEVFMKDVD